VLALLALHLGLSLRPALLAIRNDFANYYVPARAVAEGRSLDRVYERDAFQAEVRRVGLRQAASFVPHPPANALLLLPFARLVPLDAKAAWTLVLAAAYAATLPVLRLLTRLSTWTLALVLLIPSTSLWSALAYGQPYPLLLLCLALALLALERGSAFLGGALIAPAFALKLYAAPHLLLLLIGRRTRALSGALLALLAIGALGVATLGVTVHEAYWREVLPASLAGEIQDPYSPLWGSFASLAHRMFRAEPDLNPSPALDLPLLVAPCARALSAFVLLLALSARPAGAGAFRRQWALVTLAALLASPLTQSYHFVLLALPVALLLAEEGGPLGKLALLALFGFATSPLPHYFQRFAHGWANPLAYPRLWAVALLLALALWRTLPRRHVAWCGAAAATAGLLAGRPSEAPPGWQRFPGIHGYLAAAPVECEGGLAWLAVAEGAYVVRHTGGRALPVDDGATPACEHGRLALRAAGDSDEDADERGSVRVDRRRGVLLAADRDGRVRELAFGRFRRPRLSPDGARIALESWEEGSWDLRVVARDGSGSRRVTSDPANELEPAWSADGASLLFASDRGRGLGSTAVYRIDLR
jgi:hypothetical protein